MKTKRRSARTDANWSSSISNEILQFLERDEITCPYCYSYTHYTYGIECKCESCRQLINDGEVIYDSQ